MTESRQARELNEAAERLAAITRDLAFTLDRLREHEQTRMMRWQSGAFAFRGLSEEDATALALAAARRARGEIGRQVDAPAAPSEEEIARWNDERARLRREEGF